MEGTVGGVMEMTPALLGLWGVMLIGQNFSNTLVSRARNSNSLGYHASAALFSNGVWFASQFILVGSIVDALKTADVMRAIGLGVFYTSCTFLGSVVSHWFAMRYLEKRFGRN